MGKAKEERAEYNTEQGQQIHDPTDLRKYRIELPNLYDDSDLDPYEFRLLAHYKRVGACYESTRTTAEKCKMSVGMVCKARDSLHEKGFIVIDEMLSKYDTIQITVADRWAENFAKYSEMKAQKQACSPHEQACSHSETKKEPIEEEKKGNPKANVYEAYSDCFKEALQDRSYAALGYIDALELFSQEWIVEAFKRTLRREKAAGGIWKACQRMPYALRILDEWKAANRILPERIAKPQAKPAAPVNGKSWDQMVIYD